MSNLPAAKRNREFNTLPLTDKAPDVLDLEIDVVLFRPRPHFHFLDSACRRVAFGIMGLFLLRVTIFVEVGDAADGRLSGRRDFNEVQAAALGYAYRFAGVHDTDLPAIDVDHPDLGDPDLIIDPYRRLARGWDTKISSDK